MAVLLAVSGASPHPVMPAHTLWGIKAGIQKASNNPQFPSFIFITSLTHTERTQKVEHEHKYANLFTNLTSVTHKVD